MLFPRWFWIGLTATAIALAGISLAVAQPSIGFDPPPGVVIQDEGTTHGRARALNCTGAELRDAVAEEPNGLYTELPCCRSSFAACAVYRRD